MEKPDPGTMLLLKIFGYATPVVIILAILLGLWLN